MHDPVQGLRKCKAQKMSKDSVWLEGGKNKRIKEGHCVFIIILYSSQHQRNIYIFVATEP